MLTLFFVLVALGSAVYADSTCNIIPISQWSGKSINRQKLLSQPVDLVIISHSVTSMCTEDVQCENMAKEIREIHLHADFDDIGYSFLIGGNGKVYEGAGWNFVGAHTKGYNDKALGIAFIGDYRTIEPSPEALQAVQDLLSCSVKEKHLKEDYKLVGHRQLRATESPGAALQKFIESWPHWLADVKLLNDALRDNVV